MCRGINNPLRLKLRSYADRLIYLNEYLDFFPGAKMTDKIGLTELNEILLNIMPNGWSKQAYMKGFYCKYITF